MTNRTPTMTLLEIARNKLEEIVNVSAEAEQQQKELKQELKQLKGFLVKAEELPEEKGPVREVERQIRDVAHYIKRILDTWSADSETGVTKNIFNTCIALPKRVDLVETIKKAREAKVKHVLDLIEKIHFDKPKTNAELEVVRENDVIGFEDEEKAIIDYLKTERGDLGIVPIMGMPGLGKTTLAWKIYRDDKETMAGCLRIWVSIPEESGSWKSLFLTIMEKFNKHDLSSLSKDKLIQLVKELTEKDTSSMSDDDVAKSLEALTKRDMSSLSDMILKKSVRAYLAHTKFLLFVDNVHDDLTWEQIKAVLPMGNGEARVVITSREMEIAGIRTHPRMRFLSPDESWKLLQTEVPDVLKQEPPNAELERIGKQIAHQCNGLPLALVEMGRILRDMSKSNSTDTAAEWKDISENVGSRYGFDQVLKRIQLSYNKLSTQKRDCFLYLGVFPENYEIPTQTLILLWIAEGFIEPIGDKSFETIGMEILMDLINRNLLMAKKTNQTPQIKTCHVHNVIREFCKFKADRGRNNLFKEIKLQGDKFDPPPAEMSKYYRLCIHSELSKFLSEDLKRGSQLLSLLCYNDEKVDLPKDRIAVIPDRFNLLKILDSKSFKFHTFPTKVTNLKELTYVALFCRDIRSLPKEVSDNLKSLITIIVDTRSPTFEMHANIWSMPQLRHVITNAAILIKPIKNRPGKPLKLQTLRRLSPKDCTQHHVLDRVLNLKMLGFHGDISLLSRNNLSLEGTKHLEKLKLENDWVHEDSKNLHGLPKSNFFPPYIKNLTLSGTYLDWKHISTLAKIDTLRVLKLKDNAFTGRSWIPDDKGFRHLHFLLIAGTNLVFWEVSKDYLPDLKYLVLRKCEKLAEVPLDLKERLKELHIDEVPKSAVRKFPDSKLNIGLKCK